MLELLSVLEKPLSKELSEKSIDTLLFDLLIFLTQPPQQRSTETPATTYTTKLLYGDTTTRNDFTGLDTEITSQFSESF